MAKLGRKTKLTPERREIIMDALSKGMTMKDTCALADISAATFLSWKETNPKFKQEVDEAKPKHFRKLMEILEFPTEVYRDAMIKYQKGELTIAQMDGLRNVSKQAMENAKWQAARMHGLIEKQYLETAETNKDPYTIMIEAIDNGGSASEDD